MGFKSGTCFYSLLCKDQCPSLTYLKGFFCLCTPSGLTEYYFRLYKQSGFELQKQFVCQWLLFENLNPANHFLEFCRFSFDFSVFETFLLIVFPTSLIATILSMIVKICGLYKFDISWMLFISVLHLTWFRFWSKTSTKYVLQFLL